MGAEVLVAAAHAGCEALLERLVREAGCPVGAEAAAPAGLPDPYFVAAHHHDVGTIKCLRRLGEPWQTGLLSWAIQEGCSVAGLRALMGRWGGRRCWGRGRVQGRCGGRQGGGRRWWNGAGPGGGGGSASCGGGRGYEGGG